MNHSYEPLADLLEYPEADWASRLAHCRLTLTPVNSPLAPAFDAFLEKVAAVPLTALQEQYTRAFDLNPVCPLEVGYYLFGEDYRRGVFLANLRETESPFELGQAHQLPDYLPVLLRLLIRLEDNELQSALRTDCLIPAVEKMEAALKKAGSLYADLLAVVGAALKSETSHSSSRSAPPHKATGHPFPILNSTPC